MKQHFNPSRRDILRGGGALIVGFSLASPMCAAFAPAGSAPKPLALTEVDSFLAIDSKGMCTVYSGKVDLGTGVATALRQIAADELDLSFDRVNLVEGDTALTPDQGTTWGSLSIQVGGAQIRQASAAARAALLDEAARHLGTARDALTVADGIISGGGRRISYGELVGGRRFSITLDPKQPVATKDPRDFKVVGKAVPRIDIPDKITGTFTYMQDFRLPGMLHGRVVRPSAIGAKLENVDEGSIKDISTARVVRQGNFLAVVAENEWAAIKASSQLKATWSKWEGLPEQAKLFEYVRATRVAKEEVTGEIGDTAAGMAADGARKLGATYDFA